MLGKDIPSRELSLQGGEAMCQSRVQPRRSPIGVFSKLPPGRFDTNSIPPSAYAPSLEPPRVIEEGTTTSIFLEPLPMLQKFDEVGGNTQAEHQLLEIELQ